VTLIFCLEEFRDGAAGFGGFDGRVEFGLVRTGDLRDEIQVALRDGETVRELVEGNRCGRFEPARGHAGVSELRGERHGKAAGVSRGEELFRIGAHPIFKPCAEGVIASVSRTPLSVEIEPFPSFRTALPNQRILCAASFFSFCLFHLIRIYRIRFKTLLEGYIQKMTLSRKLCERA